MVDEPFIGRATTRITDAVAAVNAFQDWLVGRYLAPYSVRATYLAFAFVFIYLGIQKMVPHRSSADVELATIGGLVGIPYIPFVTFVGAWQVAIGAAFLAHRLRLAGIVFISYQAYTFGTLVVLRYVAFQPPWLSVLGVDIQWALGMYAAFILKNLVLASVFFVLVAIELDAPSPGTGGHEPGAASEGD